MDNITSVQPDVEQPIIEDPQAVDNLPVDEAPLDIPELQEQPLDVPELNEQPVEQHDPLENVEPTLRRSTRERKSTIPSDYVVYLQESDFNVGAINDRETFSQAMNNKESNLWFDAMKDEMNSMASNGVWDLVKLPNGGEGYWL